MSQRASATSFCNELLQRAAATSYNELQRAAAESLQRVVIFA
jgi:hypothetical protein